MSVYDKLFKTADEQKYFRIALPAAVECVFMSFLASADLIMVGSLGAVSIAAVSIFAQPRMVLLCFARSIASAVTLLTARKAGAKDVAGVSELLRKSLFLAGIFMGLLHTQVAVPCRYFYGAASHSVLFPAGKNLVADGRRKRLSSPGAAVQPHCHLFGICYVHDFGTAGRPAWLWGNGRDYAHKRDRQYCQLWGRPSVR